MKWPTFIVFFLLNVSLFSQEDKLVYVHIPKSGGITVESLICNRFHAKDCKRVYLEVQTTFQKYKLETYEDYKDKKFIHGHFFLYQKEFEGFNKITFLRDPVARVLSEQRHCVDVGKRDPWELEFHLLPPLGDPIDTANNVACLVLSALDPKDPSIPIETHLDHAKYNLAKKFFFVGITEKMEDSMNLLYRKMGWPLPEEIPVFNTTDSSRKYPAEILEGIRKRNWADIELYQFALKLFEKEKKESSSVSLDEEIDWVSNIDYTFSQPLDGIGWCPREELEGEIFRWICSKETATIHYPLKGNGNYFLKTEILIHPTLFQNLQIKVNDKPISIATQKPFAIDLNDGFQWCTCLGVIPANYFKKGQKTSITFSIYDPKRKPEKDYYSGRMACKKIEISKTF